MPFIRASGLFIAISALMASAPFAYAQLSLTGLERQLDLATSPQYPAGGETVDLSITSFAIDLNRSAVTWYADGKVIAQGDGLVQASVKTGALGSVTSITVVAEEEDGLIGSAQATIRPTEVDLLWNTGSYVPPFFKGRALAGTDSTIHAQALARFKRANGTFVPEKDIIYSWYKGPTQIAAVRGKSSATFAGPALFGTDVISIIATSADGAYKGRAEAHITAVDPSVELYENHPLFGVLYHRALVGSVATLENEQKVTAVPYFAHIKSPSENGLSYEWEVNGRGVAPDPEHPETITIAANGYTGPARIRLTLASAKDFLLHAIGSWELVFSESGAGAFGTNPFGSGSNR
ncbi:hypothetical protein A2765_02315 [Candidatus Kaiserbacteria bacterium RIFCSPHIGHO2_01_FULL_56_24]|uniref:BIG2 domain-containing protein n=1 Tax=Candidatus Kaiserbacteria bacterium RIFCSPHIGHO2_01_FULL_56_24 TaxID=1798487 RepID=A0A1F6DAV5_9BACT|nr:MAG: hypothetical protein A2765_02315 [Candidatus Kaiserbacteria bacterium RIFCSPHIGHO2_01_FULL_56_24]